MKIAIKHFIKKLGKKRLAIMAIFRTSAESLFGHSCVLIGKCVSSRVVVPLFLLALLLPQLVTGTALSCHKTCICASNIVSCSKINLTRIPTALPRYTSVLDLSYNAISQLYSDWTTVKLSKLHSLLLSHNGLNFLSSEAFVYVTRVRYLDLSSNALRLLEEFIFMPLEHLEVLLLYNNHISRIHRSAFLGLVSLQKLYLSQNQVSRFPLELVQERSRPEKLSLLDVSSNWIKVMSIQELQALPAWIKNGLYFHNNPMACSCDLYSLLMRWHIRQLSSAVDFRDDHTCILPGPRKATVFDLSREMNCSAVNVMDENASLGQILMLGCDTRQRDMSKTWLLPGNVPASPFGNGSSRVLPDGGLLIGPLSLEDSGVYTCFAAGNTLNETLYVTVRVHNVTQNGGAESVKTAYTTLVGCLVSVVLVLMYLYLTPCRCRCCRGRGLAKHALRDSIHSSTISFSPTGQQAGQTGKGEGSARTGLGRHVAFLEPKDLLEQNGSLNPDREETDEEQGCRREQAKRKSSDAESVRSVCSDTPIVV